MGQDHVGYEYEIPMNDEYAIDGIAALSSKIRWDVFWLLIGDDLEEASAGEISRQLDLSPSTLSFHLKQFTQTNLLRSTCRGNQVIYTPNCETVVEIAVYLTEKCGADLV